MTSKVDTLVDHYLTDLAAELHGLPATRRQELLEEVGGHITEARATMDPESEAGVRTVLERLGDPADIAAEARERVGVPTTPPKPAIPWLEVLTLAVFVFVPLSMMLGMVVLVPVLGWLVGLALLWRSHRWAARDKRVGTLLALGMAALGVAAMASPLVLLGSLLLLALTLATVTYLAGRLRAHPTAVPATG